jgi:hypothetical protein
MTALRELSENVHATNPVLRTFASATTKETIKRHKGFAAAANKYLPPRTLHCSRRARTKSQMKIRNYIVSGAREEMNNRMKRERRTRRMEAQETVGRIMSSPSSFIQTVAPRKSGKKCFSIQPIVISRDRILSRFLGPKRHRYWLNV